MTIGNLNKRTKLLSNGTKKNFLTILNFTNSKGKDGSWLYNVRCDCGTKKQLTRTQFKRTQSCGCLQVNRVRKPAGDVSFNVLLTSYKHRAKKNGINFFLIKEQFRNLISKNCFYCNAKPKDYNTYITDGNKSSNINQDSIDRAWIKANGIDRLNNDFGYVITNCVPCCEHCNRAKLDWTFEEFLIKIKNIYEFLELGKRDQLESLRERIKEEKSQQKDNGWGDL